MCNSQMKLFSKYTVIFVENLIFSTLLQDLYKKQLKQEKMLLRRT